MKNHELDTLFMKEMLNLYEWRRDFFNTMFPNCAWISEILPHMITKKFDDLVDRATLCCKDFNEYDDGYLIDYGFERHETSSDYAKEIYDERFVKHLLRVT